jgi:hypothetical protein
MLAAMRFDKATVSGAKTLPQAPLRVREEVLALRALRSVKEGKVAYVDEAAEALRNLDRINPHNLYQLAKCYARCIRLLTKGKTKGNLPSETARVRERFAKAATDALTQAVKNGYSDFARLFRDSDMVIIRQEPGYRAIIENAKQPANLPRLSEGTIFPEAPRPLQLNSDSHSKLGFDRPAATFRRPDANPKPSLPEYRP